MSLQFILGKSGSGKTSYVYDKVLEEAETYPERRYFIIVPEQFTLETQKELVKRSSGHGILNVDILSFHRLAYRIFEEKPAMMKTILEDMGKSMILRKILAQHEDELVYFNHMIKKEGFLDELKSLLSEFYQYKVDENELQQMMDANKDYPLMQYKFQDIMLVMKEFTRSMEEQYMTAEELLPLLAQVIPQIDKLRDSTFVFDEFTGFTPCQYDVLRELCKVTRDIYITGTIDPREDLFPHHNSYQLFFLTKDTIKRMTDIAAEESVEIKEPLFTGVGDTKKPYRFEGKEDLEALENNLFRYPIISYANEPEAIMVCQHKNPQCEAEYVAEEIDRLVREQGYRYRDFAIITGALESNDELLNYNLKKFNIPFFMDTKKSMRENAFAQLTMALLNMIVFGMDYENCFMFLRNPFSPLNEDETDVLENSVLALGIRGYARWNDEWRRVDETVNELRKKVVTSIEPFYQIEPGKKHTVLEFSDALRQFYLCEKYEERVAEVATSFADKREDVMAREYEKTYNTMIGLLEQVDAIMGGETVTLDEYAQIIETGMKSFELGFIPPGNDTVIIGDVIRTRLKRVRVLFFINVNDQVIPKGAKSPGLLSTRERERMKDQHIQLAPDARDGMFSEQFYLYQNMTKPSEKLYITYSQADGAGTLMRPSYLIDKMKKLFPKLAITKSNDESTNISQILGLDGGMSYMLTHLVKSDLDNETQEIYADCMRDQARKEKLDHIMEGWEKSRKEGKLSKRTANLLYGDILFGSVTRLEMYSACPFAHFAKYGLGLEERKLHEIALPDIGNVFHEALEKISSCFHEQKRSWSDLVEGEWDTIANETMDQVVNDYKDTLFYQTKRSEFIIVRMKRILSRTIWAIHEQMRRGEYEQKGYELSFGQMDHLDEVNVDLGDDHKMVLNGRIDRVDTYREKDDIYVRIIDYKTGNTSFDVSMAYHGLQMQLSVYLDAAMAMQRKENPDLNVKPGGILYYHIEDPVISVINQEVTDDDLLQRLRLNGYVNAQADNLVAMDEKIGDSEGEAYKSLVVNVDVNKSGELSKKSMALDEGSWDSFLNKTRNNMKSFGEGIYEGNVGISPYHLGSRNACTYCPYHVVCGFDERQGDEYRSLEKVDRDIFEKGGEVDD